jgi:superfamily II DNA or RNA helicase
MSRGKIDKTENVDPELKSKPKPRTKKQVNVKDANPESVPRTKKQVNVKDANPEPKPKPKKQVNVKKTYEYKKGYVIPKNALTQEETNNLVKTLTVTPEGNDDFAGKDDPSFTVFREDNNNFYVPKFWGLDTFGDRFKQEIEQKNSAINFNFNGKLRGSQPEVSQHILEKLKTKQGGILQLHTGYGKTTMAIYLASILKLKTLVLVHKTFLQDQWYERIKQFTDASVGIIRQKTIDVEGRDIVIGMLQSVSMIDYDPEIFKDFDLVILDECAHGASKVFSRAFFKINPTYTLALSATPKRNDGLTKIIHWFFGDTLIKVERRCHNVVYVKSFTYESNNILFTEKKVWRKGKMRPDTVNMTTNICNISERNKLITDIINALRFKDGRKILILSKRLNHLNILKTMMDNILKAEVKNGTFCEDEYTTAYYVGGMKDWQLKAAAEADIIYATYSMAEEGLDIDGLNTLVLANSIKDPIQAIGRILRKPIEDGDINPLVIDIGDNLSSFANWAKNRVKYYKANKYIIDNIKVYNDKVVSIYDYLIEKKVIVAGECDIETLRKAYIVHLMGEIAYTFEKNIKFKNYPDSMFEKFVDYKTLFEINCEYLDVNQGSVIEYNPISEK